MRINRSFTIAVLILLATAVSAQSLKKGTVVECNEISVSLQPGKTMEQYLDLLVNQLVPATEQAFPGTEVFIVKGNRGNAESRVGAIWVFESAEVRSRYFDTAGNPTPEGERATAEVAPVLEQLDRIGSASRHSMVWELINEPRSAATAEYYESLIEYCSREDETEVPAHPSTVGISDPMLESLVEDLVEATADLKASGFGQSDPMYAHYAERIKALKQALNETASVLAAEEGRAFQKGGSFGYHKLTVTLAPEVTMDQFLEFWTDNYIPEFVKLMEGLEALIMKPVGEAPENQFVYVNYFRSASARDRYWPEPDTPSDHTNQATEQLRPLLFDLLQLGTWEDDYGVWIIQ
jgi:hypothetical protein